MKDKRKEELVDVKKRAIVLYEQGESKRRIARTLLQEFPNCFPSFDKARERVFRWFSRDEVLEPSSEHFRLAQSKVTAKSNVYIITHAQNNTPVFEPFWNNLLSYAQHRGASIHVVAGRYKNPTSTFPQSNEDKWDERTLPYLDAATHRIHDKVCFLSGMKIETSASDPLRGLKSIGGATTIIGHPRVHFETLPYLKDEPYFLFTTGTVTLPNYTDSKRGEIAKFNHVYGFVIVEIESNDRYYIRQVTASEDGSFYDLDVHVSEDGIYVGKSVKAITFGDLHTAKLKEDAYKRMNTLIHRYSPEQVFLQDVFDGESINHHDENDPIEKYKKEVAGKNILLKEIEDTISLIEEISNKTKVNIVWSNHDEFIEKYIKTIDWKKDIKNALTYMKLTEVLLNGDAENGIFAYLVNQSVKGVNCIGKSESFELDGVEHGLHGHLGAGGSRGSVNQFKNLPIKSTVGHLHSPSRKDGVCVVGVQELNHGYNMMGLRTWWAADVIQHQDGKRQHLIHFKGKHRL